MKYMHALFDQLDLAGKHLHDKVAAYDRFALILVDNAVELMIHYKSKSEVERRCMYPGLYKPTISPTKRRKILSQFLDAKTAFCQEIGWLSENERKFVDSCHEHRNELYHVGIKHEPIIHALAATYHDFACDLIARDHGVIFWSSDDPPLSEVVLKHTDGEGARTHEPEKRNAWALSLKQTKPPLAVPLSHVLTDYAKRAVEDVSESLQFLLDDGNPEHLDAHEFLKQIQFDNTVAKKISEAYDKGIAPQVPEEYRAFIDTIKKDWKPLFSLNPVPRWQERVPSIAAAKTPIEAMNVYSQLRGDMEYLEEIIMNNAIGLDAEMDRQFEDYRLGL